MAEAGDTAGQSGALAEWSGKYVTDMLGQAQALGNKPYQAYTGPLTSGASGLQNQAFSGYGALDPNQQTGIGSYGGSTGPGTFGFGSAAGQGYAPGFTAGSFGGSRSFIMDAERARNTGQQIADITGQGYARAFDTAQGQFNTEQQRLMADRDTRMGQFNTEEKMRQRIAEVGIDQFNKEQAGLRTDEAARRGQFNTESDRQAAFDERRRGQFNTEADRQMQFDEYGRNQFNTEENRRIDAAEADRRYGLSALRDIEAAGGRQRAVEQEGITADYLQYQQEQQYPYEQLQFMQSMLQGLPVSARQTSYVDPSSYESSADAVKEILALLGYGTGGEGAA